MEDLGLTDHVNVLTAHAVKPTEAADLVNKAFDTGEISTRYRTFLDRWGRRRPMPDLPDDLARQLLLHTDWLQLVRQDPHLPAEHLPRGWPAISAERLFQRLARKYEPTARRVADSVLDEIPLGDPRT